MSCLLRLPLVFVYISLGSVACCVSSLVGGITFVTKVFPIYSRYTLEWSCYAHTEYGVYL